MLKLEVSLKKSLTAVLITTALFACSHKKEDDMDSREEAMGQEGQAADITEAKDIDPRDNVTTPDRVFFAYDSSDLVEEAKQAIREQADYVKKNPGHKVTVEGHCDERGTAEYNMGLGYRRAKAVAAELAKYGVKDAKTVTYGKSKPAVMGDTEEAHRQNRRAVTIVSLQ